MFFKQLFYYLKNRQPEDGVDVLTIGTLFIHTFSERGGPRPQRCLSVTNQPGRKRLYLNGDTRLSVGSSACALLPSRTGVFENVVQRNRYSLS